MKAPVEFTAEGESRLIVDSIPGLVAVLTPAGDVDVVNHQLVEYCGQPLEAMKQWGTNGTVHAEDLPRVVEVFTHAITSGVPYDFEARIRRFDGIYRWFQVSGLPVRDASGPIARWYVLLTDIDDRKRAEDGIRASERNLKLIIDTIPAMAWSARVDGSAEFLNQHCLDFTGLAPEQVRDWDWTSAVHPDDVSLVAAWRQYLVATESPAETEVRLRRHDGEYRWFLMRANPLRDDGGHLVKWYGVSTDIDARKGAEEALRRSERQFRRLVETIPALVWRGTAEGELDYLNQRAVEYLGHSAESLTNGRWLELIHPDHRDATIGRWLRATATGSSYDDIYQIRRADGQYRWIQSVGEPFRDSEGRIAHWYGVVIDIEDRQRAEDELHRNEAFLAEGLRLSSTGTFSWILETDEITLSKELRRICEVDEDAAPTVQQLSGLIHPEDIPMLAAKRDQIRVDLGPYEHQFRLRMPDGRVKYLTTVGHVFRHADGRLESIGATQDVTQRRLSEEALDKARSQLAHVTRVMSLGALTASIAHEVNQPLSGIITNASTCLRMLDADPPNVEGARETARRTIRDGNRASDVVARLRALFGKKEFTPEALDLTDVTREVVALSLSELQRNRVVVRSELADDLPTIAGDRVQLQQVILNLLRNASDAMVDVNDRPRHLLIRTELEDGDRVRVSVRDAGVGLDPRSIDKLFDPFYTTKTGGMGVGLSVSRSIVERHLGRLWAQSNDGPGATFSFSIPSTGA